MPITKDTFSKEAIKAMTQFLPRGTKDKIQQETGEGASVINNVWYGQYYKENVVRAIERHYDQVKKKLAKA